MALRAVEPSITGTFGYRRDRTEAVGEMRNRSVWCVVCANYVLNAS